MTPYEFVKTDYTSYLASKKIGYLDLKSYYTTLAVRNNLFAIRDMKEYIAAQDIYYEVTMSCDLEECYSHLTYFMVNAIAYGYKTCNKSWIFYFLAAWDSRKELNAYENQNISQ